MATINFLQQNLGRSKAAFYQLSQHFLRSNSSFAFVQEPYLLSSLSIPSSSLFTISSFSSRPRAAIFSSLSSSIFLSSLTCRDVCVCESVVDGARVALVSVYFPPGDGVSSSLSMLEAILSQISLPNIIIAGDFNGHNQCWGSERTNSRGTDIANFLFAHEFQLLNHGSDYTFYTIRDRRILKSIVDLTLISSPLLANNWTWRVDDLVTSSDHRCIAFQCSSTRNSTPHPSTRRWRTSNVDWTGFTRQILLHEQRWIRLFLSSHSQLILDRSTDVFLRELTNICDNNLPRKATVTKNTYWWNSDLTRLRSIARIWRNRFTRVRSPTLKQSYLSNYLRSKTEYENAIFSAKRASWNDFLSSQDCNSVWRQAYKVCKQSKKVTPCSIQLADGSQTSDSLETANQLLNAFLPDDNISNDTMTHVYTRALVNMLLPSLSSSDVTPITHDILLQRVQALNDKKAPGLDGFSANIIKQLFAASPDVLLTLYNRCRILGLFPTAFKCCRVIAIPKAGAPNPNLPKSWRPISLLSVFAKIFEKIWIDEIYAHLNSSYPLSPNQFGFTRGKSTLGAISCATSFVKRVKRRKEFGVLISLDVSSAFDEAWWPAIVLELRRRKVHDYLIGIAFSYFSNRLATLSVGPSTTSKLVTRGCPQGSACGPGLWNLLYDGVLRIELPPNCLTWAFADDLMLAVSGNSISELCYAANLALERISHWGRVNKVRFNETKTQVLPIHVRRHPDYPRIVMNGAELKCVTSMRYLGIHIDSKLNFHSHIAYLSTKVNSIYLTFARLAKNMFGLNPSVCSNIYRAAIEPALLYGYGAWGSPCPKKWLVIAFRRLQRLFLLRAAKAYRTVSLDALCIIVDVPPIDLKMSYFFDIEKFRRSLSIDDSVTLAITKALLYSRLESSWNTQWVASSKGATTKAFFPTLADRRRAQFFVPDFWVSQLVSGHGKFLRYLHKFGISPSECCRCGAVQDSLHLVCACPLMGDLRLHHLKVSLNPPFLSLFLSPSSSLSFSHFSKEIHHRLLSWETS